MTVLTQTPIQDLFAVGEKPASVRKIRPLGKLSDFVVERLPDRIVKSSGQFGGGDQLSRDIEGMIAEQNFSIPADQIEIARLDVIIIEAALRAIGAKPGKSLQGLIENLSHRTGQRPILSYQDIVLYNPRGDMRTFTGGETGKQEMDFYLGHQMIESCLWRGYKAATAIH